MSKNEGFSSLEGRELVSPTRRLNGVFYGWWLVGVSGFTMLLVTVPIFYGMSAWFPVLEKSFGWSRGQLSLAFSLTRVEGSITGPLGGYLVDRLGSRRMVLMGFLIMGCGFILFGLVQELWQFYLAFIVVSMGAGLGSWMPMMAVLNNWFLKKRATAMSRAMAGSAVGGLLLVPVLAWSIDPDRFGLDRWRDVATVIGVALLLLAVPLSLMVRNRPEDYGQRPDGDPPTEDTAPAERAPTPSEDSGFTWQEAVRTRAFWLISIGHASSAAVMTTLTVHLGSMLFLDRGVSLGTVGLVISTYLAVGAAFNLVGGYVGDRVPMRMAVFGFSVVQSVAIVVLLLAGTSPLIYVFAILLGIGFGGRAPLTTAIRGVYFGRRAYGRIMGISMLPMNAFLFVMPVYAGFMFDATESYTIPFITLAALNFVGSCFFLMIGPPTAPPLRQPAVPDGPPRT